MRILAAIACFIVALLLGLWVDYLLDAGLATSFIVGWACGSAAFKAFYWAYGDKE